MFHRVIDRMEKYELSLQTQSKRYLKHSFLYTVVRYLLILLKNMFNYWKLPKKGKVKMNVWSKMEVTTWFTI